jgi:transposase
VPLIAAVPCWWKLPRYQTVSGPLHAFFVRARRGHQIAAVARKLTVCWHLLTEDKDYLWARPALVASKTRVMELHAGKPQRQPAGPAYAYNLKTLRDQMQIAEQAERNYARFVARGKQVHRATG